MLQLKKITILLFLFNTIFIAQERVIIRTNGEEIKLKSKIDFKEVIKDVKLRRSDKKVMQSTIANLPDETLFLDTVNYRGYDAPLDVNFGFFSKDVMMMWFQAEVDMTVKAIGFACSDESGYTNDGANVGLRLVRLNWTKEELQDILLETRQGYYPSDSTGLSSADFFGEHASGNWIATDTSQLLPPWTNNADPNLNTFDYDLFSDSGKFFPVVPVKSDLSNPIYNWLEINTTGEPEPVILNHELFAIVAINNGVNLDSSRIGFWSSNRIGIPGWKFYANGRLSPDEPGWWRRDYTWDFAIFVEFNSCIPPRIRIINPIKESVYSTEAQRICAEVSVDIDCHGGGDSLDIELVYVINNLDTNKILLTSPNNYDYCAEIPGQVPGTEINYWVQAVNSAGQIIKMNEYHYSIYKQNMENLLVFNGFTSPNGYPQEYYWGTDTSYIYHDFQSDIWCYGPLTKELIENYQTIIEICTTGPSYDNREVIKEWIESGKDLAYFLAGQEYLNIHKADNFNPGSFEYDILGITKPYLNVSFDGTEGYELPSKIIPLQGTRLGDAMYIRRNELIAEGLQIDSICYDPIYELNLNNYLDGFEVLEDDNSLDIFLKAETRGINGLPEVKEVSIGVSRRLDNGSFISFVSFDPISINSKPDYFWFGNSNSSPQMQFLNFLPIRPSVDDNNFAPIKFSLSQNYPNPFNPATTIKYAIPDVSLLHATPQQVTLKVYDILGREIATLVNGKQKPGNHEVKFDSSTNGLSLSSGIYFYRLTAGSFIESRKMVLLK